MFKNIMNNTPQGVGKSIYNIELNGSNLNNTNSNLEDFINSLAPVTIVQTTTSSESEKFSNVSADTITTNILTVLENFYVGADQLFHIALSDITTTNGTNRQNTIITTNNYQSSTLIYTSINLNVPYFYPDPDYVPNSSLHEAPDNYLEVYDSKFRITGPFTEIQSRKTVMTAPIFTVGYLDRVEFDTSGSTTTATPYDRGISFEYVNLGSISVGFYGYSTQYDRFVFYKTASNNGTTTYPIYKNGISTGQTGTYTDYNVTRFDTTSLTSVEADVLYSHIINSSDQIHTSLSSGILDRSLTINSYGKLSINVDQDSSLTPGIFDLDISVQANIIESSVTFSGTYTGDYTVLCPNAYFGTVSTNLTSFNINSSTINFTSYGSSSTSINIVTNSTGGINMTSGTTGTNISSTGIIEITSGTTDLITITAGINGIDVSSTGEINIYTTGNGTKTNINTINIGNEVDIGNQSIIKLNNYAQISNYMSLGSSSRNVNTIFEIMTNLTSTGESSTILITPTINGFANNSTQSFLSSPIIITQSGSTVPLITNMSLYPVNLTVGSTGTVTNSSTLYIDGETTNGQSNYSMYSKIGNIFFGGSNGNVFFNSTNNIFKLIDTVLNLEQNTGNSDPYLSVSNSSRQLNYYMLSATNIIGSGQLYLDGISTHITMINNYIYNGIGTISAVQSDGTSCQFQISFVISVIEGIVAIKSSNTNINYNELNNFSYTLSTNMANNIIFNVSSVNSNQTNWSGNISITITQL